jgi:hypothetical protein
VPSTVSQWFIQTIEGFAPAALYDERQQVYETLQALQPDQEPTLTEDIGLYVLAQIVAAQQWIAVSTTSPMRRGGSAHATWYAKERQRITKLLLQITDSPVVASFQSTIRYYAAEDITCPHGRNTKTCEALYALSFTLELLGQHPPHGAVRKQVERLRQREPFLPPLHDLCAPQAPTSPEGIATATTPPLPSSPPVLDERTTYLLATVIGRLRQAGFTVAQSCDLVDRILSCCFGQADPSGTRAVFLAEQWRRLG